MKQKITFALIMRIVTIGIISFTMITVNLRWAHLHLAVWLKSWLIVIPAILIFSPFVEKKVKLLIAKK